MNQRNRKLVGTVLIVGIALLYAVVATTIATAKLADAGPTAHMFYFLISGLCWVVPAMFIINWMMRPDEG